MEIDLKLKPFAGIIGPQYSLQNVHIKYFVAMCQSYTELHLYDVHTNSDFLQTSYHAHSKHDFLGSLSSFSTKYQ